MSRHALIETLAAALAHQAAGALAVGVSGGMDSTVLLHALAQLPGARARGLRAIHVDHGIHADSARWARHCQSAAHGLGLECCVIAVQVVCADTGLEDAARRVRYAALAEELREGEILVLAHHRDDQAETILLKLLRGAGPEGLGGMRAQRALGRGKLWRPLLDLPRSALAGYAEEHGLAWIEDPSNADTRLRRNFLRRRVLPLVTERWPEATAALAHSARWARDAAEFIDRESATALAALRRAQATALDWRGWLTLAPALRDPVLRRWLRELGADEPGHQHVAELERQLRDAGGDRAPCVRFATTELRRYRDDLHLVRPQPEVDPDWHCEWNGAPLELPGGGTLCLVRGATAGTQPLPAFVVGYRRGGEKLKPAGKPHTRELRLLLQELGVPPWERPRLPLVFADGELAAVGDIVLSAAGQNLLERLGARIVWTRPHETL